MKRKISFASLHAISFVLLMLSGAPQAHAASPVFATLTADQPQGYVLGSKAVLMAYINIQPADPRLAIDLEASLGQEKVRIIPISPTQATTVTAALDRTGALDWEVDVYLGDAQLIHEFRGAIQCYEQQINALQNKIAVETDPDQLAVEQQQLQRDQNLMAVAQQQLAAQRRLVETDHLTINVNSSRPQLYEKVLNTPPAMTVSASPLYLQYPVGQSAHLTMTVNQLFFGPDGPKENVVRATLDGQPIGVTQVDASDFYSDTAVWTTTGLGQHLFQAQLLVRSQAQANSLRQGITLAEQRRTYLIGCSVTETDPLKLAQIQNEISNLTAVVSAYYAQLESILVPIETDPLGFTVVSQ